MTVDSGSKAAFVFLSYVCVSVNVRATEESRGREGGSKGGRERGEEKETTLSLSRRSRKRHEREGRRGIVVGKASISKGESIRQDGRDEW